MVFVIERIKIKYCESKKKGKKKNVLRGNATVKGQKYLF